MFEIGDKVRLSHAPLELLNGLPDEDQKMIREAVNKMDMTVTAKIGTNVELEFRDTNNTLRWILVKTTDLHPLV